MCLQVKWFGVEVRLKWRGKREGRGGDFEVVKREPGCDAEYRFSFSV